MENYKKQLLAEEERAFIGWDFSSLDGRWEEEELPWDYKDIVSSRLKSRSMLLDMGTGGGEFLLTLNYPYKMTAVTEAYEPNLFLCNERLRPLGVNVQQSFDGEQLPFENDTFDIIINRHETYDVKEVQRILKSDGLFITQQVGGKNSYHLSKSLNPNYTPLMIDFNLHNELKKFIEFEFEILYSNEYFPFVRFYDVGAFVYFAKIIEWEFPGFSVETYFEKLKVMQSTINSKGYIEGDAHRFIIVAQNRK